MLAPAAIPHPTLCSRCNNKRSFNFFSLKKQVFKMCADADVNNSNLTNLINKCWLSNANATLLHCILNNPLTFVSRLPLYSALCLYSTACILLKIQPNFAARLQPYSVLGLYCSECLYSVSKMTGGAPEVRSVKINLIDF